MYYNMYRPQQHAGGLAAARTVKRSDMCRLLTFRSPWGSSSAAADLKKSSTLREEMLGASLRAPFGPLAPLKRRRYWYFQ